MARENYLPIRSAMDTLVAVVLDFYLELYTSSPGLETTFPMLSLVIFFSPFKLQEGIIWLRALKSRVCLEKLRVFSMSRNITHFTKPKYPWLCLHVPSVADRSGSNRTHSTELETISWIRIGATVLYTCGPVNDLFLLLSFPYSYFASHPRVLVVTSYWLMQCIICEGRQY
jgi:hypothetical protein